MGEVRIEVDTCPEHGPMIFRVDGSTRECAEHVDEEIAKGLRPETERVRLLDRQRTASTP